MKSVLEPTTAGLLETGVNPGSLMTAALVLDGDDGLAVREVALARPGHGEVLVRIEASGVCHSDLHARDGKWPVELPIVLGHEGAGVVEEIGPGVRSVAPGDHVVLAWIAPCHRCAACVSGSAWACTNHKTEENLLPDGTSRFELNGTPIRQMFGLGTFSRHTVVAESSVVAIPKDVPFDIASLLGCGVATGVGSVVNLAQVRPGESVAVIGCGGVGLSVILGAVAAGAHPILAIDLEPEKAKLALSLGASKACTVSDAAATRQGVQDLVGDGVDYAFDVVGMDSTAELMVSLLRVGGTGVVVGVASEAPRIRLDPIQGHRIMGSNYGGCSPAVDFPRLAQLYLAGKLPVERLISDHICLSDVEGAFESLRQRQGARSVIMLSPETSGS